MTTIEELDHRLHTVLRRATGDASLVVTERTRIPAGASRDTWAVRVRGERFGKRDLILRMDRPGGLEADAMAREAALMRAARTAGVPSPEVIAAAGDEDELGAAYVVMSRVEGESLPQRILRSPELATARDDLARQCGAVLARIHTIDPAQVPGLEGRDELDDLRRTYDRFDQAHPAFELAFRWLDQHRPVAGGATTVHGDFRNGNFIVGTEGIRAVLDWELAHVGDPVEDLGWLCIRAWRFGGEAEVGGFGRVEDLLAGYRAAGGSDVDREALHWWIVLGTLKWGVICIHQAHRHRSGATRSVELAAIGRRVPEVEWDLLQLLG